MKIQKDETPKHTSMQVPVEVKAALKQIQAQRLVDDPGAGTQPMGLIMAEAIAEKFPEYVLTFRKAGLIE